MNYIFIEGYNNAITLLVLQSYNGQSDNNDYIKVTVTGNMVRNKIGKFYVGQPVVINTSLNDDNCISIVCNINSIGPASIDPNVGYILSILVWYNGLIKDYDRFI